ncbi:RNA polymerase sigma factor [Lichenifustis flavocetrariae]|uniref:RNA polymerase subunit sigma-70 n=1 Tax=Lichenifustis flavocetrariae TaxID=2949735 RepID=A0AA41YZH3_9HYPH|nr:sigma factor-like helix-turn-helix DNA-binding protein [Lichenifustis flavocetrariae]MCW6510125.1 RNA polymerase subunit sigma-70 [Lichenifustis flavocetrariae]
METIRDIGYRDELARFTPNLRRYARALVRNHSSEAADELVQTTLTRALGGDQARRGARLLVWLVSILTGLHREQVRDIGAEQKLGFGGGESPTVGSSSSWKSARRDPALLSSIPLEYREALLLVVLENMSYAQVAECLGLSVTTVGTRVARARDYLAKAQAGWSSDKPLSATQGKAARTPAPYLRVVK